ncbi:adenylate cyclase [Paracoccidioides lutzii Pb01]|uniref:Adenylate cyclase n=1 Tax=Paracoccidioides lutzii (strain ATCC MYA-826 / Pb01) TaxID=502779 RepID=C1GRJ7_PARBA|nr:adenylate cyclase [Paracoccidioides lutzii Pb01]EEH38221.2 adenylate cyclase [Paracoccidioides lutzii Pb01]
MARRQRDKDRNLRRGSEMPSSLLWRSPDALLISHGHGLERETRRPSRAREISDQDDRHASSSKSNSNAPCRPHSPDVSPTEVPTTSFGNHKKALAILGASDDPSVSQMFLQYSSTNARKRSPSWTPPASLKTTATRGTFFNDGSDAEETSPQFQLEAARTDPSNSPEPVHDEHRRPSVASATTVSSQGSKGSGGRFHKRLRGFFGDEHGSASDSALPERSLSNRIPTSSGSQSKDIPNYGDAPVYPVPGDPDIERFGSMTDGERDSKKDSRLPFHRHRHARSKEEKPSDPGSNSQHICRSSDHDNHKQVYSKVREGTLSPTIPTALGARSISPSPSLQGGSGQESQGTRSPGGSSNKRSFFTKIRRHPKAPIGSSLRGMPSSKSAYDGGGKGSRFLKRDMSPSRCGRNSSFDSVTNTKPWESVESDRKKESAKGVSKFRHPRFPFGHDTGNKDDKNRQDNFEQDRIWKLDTDLTNLSGIVAQPQPLSPTDCGGIYTGTPLPEHKEREFRNPFEPSSTGDWHAPESWAVRKVGDDILSRLPELTDDGGAMVDDEGRPYCVRIFRIDSTFTTLSSNLNTTVTEILEMLGRKSFLQDELNNYDIVVRKNDLSRTLDYGERPILMQKKLLEQAGYQPSDRIADIGREDNSYLCCFTFLPTKLSGYSSLDADLGINENQKFSHVDLHGRSLITLPITLYKRASEIISLNLSRNLALDIPKDFIQSCINLRELKYIGNEAWRLPASLSLATRLTYLDVSNNRLEQLDNAELHNLQGLVSLKMSNNNLSTLPAYFGDFPALRSLNISSNSYRTFPECLYNLKSLVDLDISFNKISELSDIGRLTTLERLWVTNNGLHGPLGETFRDLVNLKEIDARFNSITSIDNITHLPRLERLLIGHNSVSTFSGSFMKLRTLALDHCPVTEFDLTSPLPTLTSLNIASAKLNHFVTLSSYIGTLRKLEHFSISKNPLSTLPPTIGCLTELKCLNLRECNLNKLPSELWYCCKLETLNVSSNVLDSFPKIAGSPPIPPNEYHGNGTPATTPGLVSPSHEELGKLEDFEARRPSHSSSGLLSVGSSSANSSNRKGSIVSMPHNPTVKKSSVASRGATETPSSRKDSTFSQRISFTFAGSLKQLYLADNRLEDDVFQQLAFLVEIRILNLSYNELTEIPQGLLRRWQYLVELHVSGNQLSALPSDDLEESSSLKVLHINGNKFQVLPAELCKVNRLAILDVGSNSLKYNVSNWPYDWNWNWNRNLKYLNFSGNKRFEIKPNTSYTSGIPACGRHHPLSGSLAYGMADSLGRNEHLSIVDMLVTRFRGNQTETVLGLFDGQSSSSSGSRIAKYLQEHFTTSFTEELKKLRPSGETPLDALRRTFLGLNKDIATAAQRSSMDDRELHHFERGTTTSSKLLTKDDYNLGGVATVLYLQNMELFVANVGDAQAVLVHSNGDFKFLTCNHDPAEASERERIRAAGGFVSRNGKLNDKLSVSRAFGYYPMMPAVIAAPSTRKVTLTAQDEMIILASGELWEYVTPDVVVDVARSEHGDLMIASQKLRDLAIAYGATNKIMVMIAGVSDLKRRGERPKLRNHSISMGLSPLTDEHLFTTPSKIKKRGRPGDSRLARLDRVEAPTGELAIIFTDIKKSTSLWETYPVAMRSAIQIHNDLFRRQLAQIGGFEVKTEGDAFMVSFSTATAALLWCFTCQSQLLEAEWPTEIMESPACRPQYDSDDNIIYRGLSVRMGVHWGTPVCEQDPVTGRMDYFGPMVNRASRISAVADGGQIFVSADFVAEIQRNLETFADYDRIGSMDSSEDNYIDDYLNHNIRRELYQLSTQGFEVKDMGERKLKGLENPEFVYLMYPHSLAGRLNAPRAEIEEADTLPIPLGQDKHLSIEADLVWRLWTVALRLEAFCSALENFGEIGLRQPEMGLIDAVKQRPGELSDAVVLSLIEHQVTRVETCANTLTIRHMMRPFKRGNSLKDIAVPMSDILNQLKVQLSEFRALKESISPIIDSRDPPQSLAVLKSPIQSSSALSDIMAVGGSSSSSTA